MSKKKEFDRFGICIETGTRYNTKGYDENGRHISEEDEVVVKKLAGNNYYIPLETLVSTESIPSDNIRIQGDLATAESMLKLKYPEYFIHFGKSSLTSYLLTRKAKVVFSFLDENGDMHKGDLKELIKKHYGKSRISKKIISDFILEIKSRKVNIVVDNNNIFKIIK